MSERRFTLGHSLRVVFAMGWSDFLLKYRGSVLGYLWSLIGPLAKFLVILYVFGPYISPSQPQYPLYLFLGIIIWEHFVLTTNSCMSMLYDKESIIQKLLFPRLLLIFMVGWTNAIIFATHLLIFECFLYFFHVPFGWNQLYAGIILVQMSLVAMGIGMMLSAYSLRYKDIHHLWSIATQILFWLTPITYPYHAESPLSSAFMNLLRHPNVTSLTRFFDLFVQFQPMSIVIHDAHRGLLYAAVPSVTHVVVFTLICVGIFVFGARIFLRRCPYFIQEY
jgi:ABC-type polysaccharide/polyol phosphate export permease